MKHVAIVLSAGKGSRIGGDIPKQYMDLDGKPVLYYSLKTFQDSFIDEIIIVCAEEFKEFIKSEIVDRYSLSKVVAIVTGGAERSDSVYNGLLAVREPDKAYVYVHDGARANISKKVLDTAREDVINYGSAVVAVNSKDTVKTVDENGYVVSTPDRNLVFIIQTPQVFLCNELMDAYTKLQAHPGTKVTDDSSVMELYGNRKIHISKGDYCNIKITTIEDFQTATNFLKKIENNC